MSTILLDNKQLHDLQPANGLWKLYDPDNAPYRFYPENLLVIGGGVIGCELANIFCRFGSKVKILEYLSSILSIEEPQIIRELKKKFKIMGIEIDNSRFTINLTSLFDYTRMGFFSQFRFELWAFDNSLNNFYFTNIWVSSPFLNMTIQNPPS